MECVVSEGAVKKILGSLLLLGSSWLQAADSLTINVNKNSPQFVVALPSNPTTGFQWTVKHYDRKLLQLKSSNYIAPKTKLIGAGGQMTFTFAPIKGKTYPASTKMSFAYARSWEAKQGALKHVTINFTR